MRDTLLPAVPGPQVADDTLVLRVLDLALRIGEVQLATGAGAAVAHDTMLSIARTYGLPTCDVDIAFSTITMCCHRGKCSGNCGLRLFSSKAPAHARHLNHDFVGGQAQYVRDDLLYFRRMLSG